MPETVSPPDRASGTVCMPTSLCEAHNRLGADEVDRVGVVCFQSGKGLKAMPARNKYSATRRSADQPGKLATPPLTALSALQFESSPSENMRNFRHHVIAGLAAIALAGTATAQKQEFTNWPAGTSPRDVGKKIVQNMLPRWIPTKPSVHYAEDSTWYAALDNRKG